MKTSLARRAGMNAFSPRRQLNPCHGIYQEPRNGEAQVSVLLLGLDNDRLRRLRTAALDLDNALAGRQHDVGLHLLDSNWLLIDDSAAGTALGGRLDAIVVDQV